MLSHNAGGYLCNYAFWGALEAAKKPGGPKLVAFVHIPPQPRPRPKHAFRNRRARMPSLANLTRSGEAILMAMAAALPAIRPD
jgi:pyroglutamyl-peptidase